MKARIIVGAALVAVFLMMGVFGVWLAPYSPHETHYDQILRAPDRHHIMGTDPLGRDIMSRLICGTRTTMGLALIIAVFNAVIAVSLGALSGFLGGWIEIVIMRLADALLALPGFLLAVCFLGVFGGGAVRLALFLVLTGWAPLTRVVRNEISIVKNQDYITANASVGYSKTRNLFLHAVPAVLPSLLILFVISLIGDVFVIVSMSFLGLGLSPQIPEWGMVLHDSRDFILMSPWLFVFPSAFIGFFALGLHLMADGLREFFDAKKILYLVEKASRFSYGGTRAGEIEP